MFSNASSYLFLPCFCCWHNHCSGPEFTLLWHRSLAGARCDTREVLWRDNTASASLLLHPPASPAAGHVKVQLLEVTMYSPEGHYRPYSSQKSRDRRQRRPPEPVSEIEGYLIVIFCCREKEDRVLHFPYRSLLAEQRPLEVKAATGGHYRATGIVVASGHQEVKGMEE